MTLSARTARLLSILVLLNALVIADLYARAWPDSMRRMALDLTQPSATPEPGRQAVVTRTSIASFVTRALDPKNPLGLDPAQVQRVRGRAQDLLQASRHMMWLQCRLLEALPRATVERFLTLLESPESRLWGMPGNWDENLQVMLAAFPTRAAPPFANEVPARWALSAERSDMQRLWSSVFDAIPLGHYELMESGNLIFLRWLSLDPRKSSPAAAPKPWTGQLMSDLCFAAQSLRTPWSSLATGQREFDPATVAVTPENDLTFVQLVEALERALDPAAATGSPAS